ncbi:MAG: helix-turn-helix domain-containing protein [Sediminibacterium sp.]
MENVQLLIPIEPKEFWRHLKSIVEEVISENQKMLPENKHLERPLLKASQICEIFHVSKPTLYSWLKSKKIKSVKIESRRYFHWKDVEELIEKSKITGLDSTQ